MTNDCDVCISSLSGAVLCQDIEVTCIPGIAKTGAAGGVVSSVCAQLVAPFEIFDQLLFSSSVQSLT